MFWKEIIIFDKNGIAEIGRDHSFGTFRNFPGKLTFLNPW